MMLRFQIRSMALVLMGASMLLTTLRCNRKTGEALGTSAVEEERVLALWDDVQHAPLEPAYLEVKSKLGIDVPDLNIGVRLHWYWAKDSILWIRVTKIIETHRIMITPDSFKMVDNLNNEYVYGSTGAWLTKQKLPVDFNGFQRLLLGQCPDLTSNDKPELSITRDSIWFRGSKPLSTEQLHYAVNVDWAGKDIMQMLFNVSSGEQIAITQDQFTDSGHGKDIPWIRHYHVETPTENYNFDLEINDWKVNQPKAVYFQIPTSYERVPL